MNQPGDVIACLEGANFTPINERKVPNAAPGIGTCEDIRSVEDEKRRKTLSERLEQLFRPGAVRENYRVEEARRRLALLERWLRGRIERDDDPAPFERALSFCLDTADEIGASLPVTALVDQFYKDVQAMGGNRWDTSSLIARLRTRD